MRTKTKNLMTTKVSNYRTGTKSLRQSKLPIAFVTDGFFVKPVKDEEMVKIYFDSIEWIEAEKSYSHFHLVNNKIVTISINLGKVDEVMPLRTFVRINRSEIVNIHLVDGIMVKALKIRGRRMLISKKYYDYVMSCLPCLI